MKILPFISSRTYRRLKKYANDSLVAVTQNNLHEVAAQFKYPFEDVVKLYDALPVENRNKAYLELLLKTLSRAPAATIQDLLMVMPRE